MTSIFEVSPNKAILQTEGMTQETSKKMKQDAAAAQIKENEPTSRRYFLICQTCFWCASYIDIMGNMDDLHYKACPTCNDNRVESLPISDNDRYHFKYTTNHGVLLEFVE